MLKFSYFFMQDVHKTRILKTRNLGGSSFRSQKILAKLWVASMCSSRSIERMMDRYSCCNCRRTQKSPFLLRCQQAEIFLFVYSLSDTIVPAWWSLWLVLY